jgi:hypothetical protein
VSVKVLDFDSKPVTDVCATGITDQDFAPATSFPNTDTVTVYDVDPKQGRLSVVIHEKRKLVGTATINAEDKNPSVKLGNGGSVTGRVVDDNAHWPGRDTSREHASRASDGKQT